MGSVQITNTEKDVRKVSKNIQSIYKRREVIAFALASSMAVRALNTFRKNQADEKYWINRTQQAFQRVFSKAFQDNEGIGFYLAHGVEYGVYLELANGREHSALRPIMSGLAISFVKRLRKLYGKG